jgi:hypothetical protein
VITHTALFDLPDLSLPGPPTAAGRKRRTVLSYGLGADSTAILLKFLTDPARYGLEPDLSDLIVVHAVTGDEWPDTLDYVDRLVLPLLRAAGVRLVQIARGGAADADGVVILDDSRSPRRVVPCGPWRLSDELRIAGTVPQLARGRRTCSIRFKGWCLDAWAEAEFGTEAFRRVIGYHYGELGRAEEDSRIQREQNADAGRTICEPHYPLILERVDRAAVESYVAGRLGEPIRKSYCTFCPFSGVCASRVAHEARLRAHPHLAAAALRLEYVSMALNENMALYGKTSLYRRLLDDDRNEEILRAFTAELDQAHHAVYEVRRVYRSGRTKECKTWHGRTCRAPRWWCHQERTSHCRRTHPATATEPWCPGASECRGKPKKGQAWRSVRTVGEGNRHTAENLVDRFARRHRLPLTTGKASQIRRAHYLQPQDGFPTAAGYLVAAPADAQDKERGGFERQWTAVTGRTGTWCKPVRDLPPPSAQKKTGGRPSIHRATIVGDVMLIT